MNPALKKIYYLTRDDIETPKTYKTGKEKRRLRRETNKNKK
jgi:hypothetical protein